MVVRLRFSRVLDRCTVKQGIVRIGIECWFKVVGFVEGALPSFESEVW